MRRSSVLSVIIQLIGVTLKEPHRHLLYWAVLAGITAFVTDMVLSAGGV